MVASSIFSNRDHDLLISRFARRMIGFSLLAAALSVAVMGLACSGAPRAAQPPASSEDLSMVWDAWEQLIANYAAPDSLDERAVAGGAINRILALGEYEPYPFLTDLGRMRGQAPSEVPAGLTDVWRATQQYRLENPGAQPEELAETLIRGLMDGLPDARATFLTDEQLPEAQERLEKSVEGSYLGIGARVVSQDNRILLFPFADSPAEKAGIEPGDALVAVEGVPVGGATPQEVGERIRGEEGTKVALQLERLDEPELVELEVFRGNVELPTVASQLLQGGIGYIRVYRFRDNTGQQVFDALERLNRFDMLALILDLRLNSGGSMDAAAKVAGQFLPPGEVFRRVESRDGTIMEHRFPEDDRRLSIDDLTVAVLVDEQTVGEAEAVAAALQEAERATLVGIATFGEGSDYSFISLEGGSALYIPTSRWYTSGGTWVGDEPVMPDIVVEYQEIPVGIGGERQFNTAYEFLDSQLPLFR